MNCADSSVNSQLIFMKFYTILHINLGHDYPENLAKFRLVCRNLDYFTCNEIPRQGLIENYISIYSLHFK